MKAKSTERDKDTVVELSEAQMNPYLARPEQFQPIKQEIPFDGQHGASQREYSALIAEADSQGKPRLTGQGQTLPTAVDDAKKPHTKLVVSPGNRK